jgi:hypothetical protein
MTKKQVSRKIDIENIKISESLKATVTRRVIIPPKFTNRELEVNYFTPRFTKVL